MTAPDRLRHADDCPAWGSHDCSAAHPEHDIYHPPGACICGFDGDQLWQNGSELGKAEFSHTAEWGVDIHRCTLCERTGSEDWMTKGGHLKKPHFKCIPCNRWFTDKSKHLRYRHKTLPDVGQTPHVMDTIDQANMLDDATQCPRTMGSMPERNDEADCLHCAKRIFWKVKDDPVQGGRVEMWVHVGTNRKNCDFVATPK